MTQETFDPKRYCCEEARNTCKDCALKGLYPHSDKPCIDYVLELGKSIVRRLNRQYEDGLVPSKK